MKKMTVAINVKVCEMERISVGEFGRQVQYQEGYVFSDGTCNPQHLLAKAFDLINFLNGNEELMLKIWNQFKWNQTGHADFPTSESYCDLFRYQYTSWAEIKNSSEAMELWCEEVFDYFNEIAPNGYHFSSSEGDGALFGWFKIEEETGYDCPKCLSENTETWLFERKQNCLDCKHEFSLSEEQAKEIKKMRGVETYIMVWQGEEEKWYYFIGDFDKKQFVDGYVDYYIEVEEGLIIVDTYSPINEGKIFNQTYDKNLWNKNFEV